MRPYLLAPRFAANRLWLAAREVPSWHIAPIRTGTVTDLISGSQIITFTNSSPAWGFNSSGVLVQPSANVPFIEYDPVTLQSLGWRIWDAVANVHIYSEDVSQWSTPNGVTTAVNQTTAPTRLTTADQYLETSATGLHVQDGSALSFVAGTQYTYSCFVKSIGRNYEIGFPTIFGSTTRFARFNLTTGAIQGTDSGVGALIIPCRDGWYRCFANSTCVTSAGARIGNFINNDSFSRTYAGDTSKGLFIFGAQINVGPLAPYPYVPTTNLAASSTADVASITGGNFSAIWNAVEMTIYAEGFTRSQATTAVYPRLFAAVGANAGNDEIGIYSRAGVGTNDGAIFASSTVSGATQADLLPLSGSAVNNYKSAFAFKANDFALCNNGIAPSGTAIDASGSLPSVSEFRIYGQARFQPQPAGYVRELALFRSRRPNSNLQAMTQ